MSTVSLPQTQVRLVCENERGEGRMIQPVKAKHHLERALRSLCVTCDAYKVDRSEEICAHITAVISPIMKYKAAGHDHTLARVNKKGTQMSASFRSA